MSISNFLTPEQANQLLDQQFNSPQGIARLNPLAFRYQNALYPGYEDFIGAYSQIDPNAPMYEDFSKPQPDFASLYSLPKLDTSRFADVDLESGYLDRAGSSDQDIYAEEAPSQGLASLKNLIPGSLLGNLLSGIFGEEPPEVRAIKDFYAKNYGVNTAGSVASGIMQGYNPVSGGFLNYITGGRFGEPMQVGLAGAMQKRIENILGRKAAQTDASRARVEELRNLQLQEMRDRAAGGESLSSIGKSTFSGKGKAFEAKPSGAYSKGFAGGR